MAQEVERSSTDRKGQRVDPWINRKGCIKKDHNNLVVATPIWEQLEEKNSIRLYRQHNP